MGGAKINDLKLLQVRLRIADRLDEISKIVGPAFKLTLIARHTTNEEAHILLSEGDERAALAAAAKLLDETGVPK